jgi:DNA-binding LytR/AlgR family response regulator
LNVIFDGVALQMGAAWRKTARHGCRRATHGGKRQLMGDLAKKPPYPAFMRCHLAYIVILNRARVPAPRNSRDYNLHLDPPVNLPIPIARQRLERIRKIIGL